MFMYIEHVDTTPTLNYDEDRQCTGLTSILVFAHLAVYIELKTVSYTILYDR